MLMVRILKRRRLWLCVAALCVSALALLRWQCDGAVPALLVTAQALEASAASRSTPIAWVRGKNQHTGYLRHVHEVLHHLGYTVVNYTDNEAETQPWDLLWSHAYPFKELRPLMLKLQPHQMVNHFPGTGYISNKVTLAESGLKSVPRAFRIPKDKAQLLAYAKMNPDTMFVHKSNNHRGIKIKPLAELDLTAEGSFVQEFIHNPLLVDGHKFDLGVYVVLASVQPLRVYMFAGEILFRFCPEKYFPFDAAIHDKYVVGDDYLPTWKVSPLIPYYTLQGFSMKDSFDAWMKDQGKDPEVVWTGVKNAIAEVFYSKEEALIKAVSNYKTRHNFFEMMRFDLIVDEDLRVYLMEANMSPNLSSAHFKPNKLLYRQVIKNILSVATPPVNEQIALLKVSMAKKSKKNKVGESTAAGELEIPDELQITGAVKDVSVFPEHCVSNCLGDDVGSDDAQVSSCDEVACQLCPRCLSGDLLRELLRTHAEHARRGACRRVIPPPLRPETAHSPANISGINPDNTLLTEWFRGKCLLDVAFCS